MLRVHVRVAERARSVRRADSRERRDDLDRVDLGHDLRQHRGLVAGAGADLEHAAAGRRPASASVIQRDDVGLRDRLAVADRQRAVLVRRGAGPRRVRTGAAARAASRRARARRARRAPRSGRAPCAAVPGRAERPRRRTPARRRCRREAPASRNEPAPITPGEIAAADREAPPILRVDGPSRVPPNEGSRSGLYGLPETSA